MDKIVKQVAGVDVAKNELVVTFARMDDQFNIELVSHQAFSNVKKGFEHLLKWVGKLTDPEVDTRFVMEATGVYHEAFAYFLAGEKKPVSIVLPNKISNYFKTLDVKTITDKTASQVIARFGLERKLDDWVPAQPVFKKLRQLTRERDQIVQMRTVAKNQLHAEESEAEPNGSSLSRIKKMISFLDKQIDQVIGDIDRILATAAPELKEKVQLICTIPGVGLLTTATVLGETNGFELIRNKRQLTSYAGLDIREKQSGISIHGKPRISKKGNKFLRKAMHMPALAAIRCNEQYKALFHRLVSKHGIRMKATVAAQRKLLELIYTIFKTGKPFDKNHIHAEQKATSETQ